MEEAKKGVTMVEAWFEALITRYMNRHGCGRHRAINLLIADIKLMHKGG